MDRAPPADLNRPDGIDIIILRLNVFLPCKRRLSCAARTSEAPTLPARNAFCISCNVSSERSRSIVHLAQPNGGGFVPGHSRHNLTLCSQAQGLCLLGGFQPRSSLSLLTGISWKTVKGIDTLHRKVGAFLPIIKSEDFQIWNRQAFRNFKARFICCNSAAAAFRSAL